MAMDVAKRDLGQKPFLDMVWLAYATSIRKCKKAILKQQVLIGHLQSSSKGKGLVERVYGVGSKNSITAGCLCVLGFGYLQVSDEDAITMSLNKTSKGQPIFSQAFMRNGAFLSQDKTLQASISQSTAQVRTEMEALMTIDERSNQLDSFNTLQAKYDELQSEFGDQEAALVAHKIFGSLLIVLGELKLFKLAADSNRNEYKGVPPPLVVIIPLWALEDIDDSLYVYGLKQLDSTSQFSSLLVSKCLAPVVFQSVDHPMTVMGSWRCVK
ncbi:hypothetical protein Tco_0908629 [Tanacetum coccineum]|uniref:Uncharacterized protein n=1 Tax=Tanacetum coccineum TaxID=301880 RepID=A0ABQ5CNR6_9ASTR